MTKLIADRSMSLAQPAEATGPSGDTGRLPMTPGVTSFAHVGLESTFLLCYVRGPEGLIVELAERLDDR
jgi:hypothetical protein